MTVVEWLLESDPSIRWQVMRDLTDEPDDVVAAERSRVASEGWAARLLDRQAPDGQWGESTYTSWIDTPDGQATCALMLLRDMGLDATSEQARRAVTRVRDNITNYQGGQALLRRRSRALHQWQGSGLGRLLRRALRGRCSNGSWASRWTMGVEL